MKTNVQLRKDVLDELIFDPSVSSENVAVSAKDGVITLTGSVSSYADKYSAERAVFRVSGVKAVVCWISPSLSHPISPSLSHPLSPGLNHLIS